MSHLRLLNGGGDVVEVIERLLERAREGKVEGVVLVECGQAEGRSWSGWSWGYRDDIVGPAWARLVAATAATQHELLTDGLE